MTVYLMTFNAFTAECSRVQTVLLDFYQSAMLEVQWDKSVGDTTFVQRVFTIESNIEQAKKCAVFVDVTDVPDVNFVYHPVQPRSRLWIPQWMAVSTVNQLFCKDCCSPSHLLEFGTARETYGYKTMPDCVARLSHEPTVAAARCKAQIRLRQCSS